MATERKLPKVGEVIRLPNGLGEPSEFVGTWTGKTTPSGEYIIDNVHVNAGGGYFEVNEEVSQ